ncbi:hypothetical protein VP1G_04854 [Cytospora mali]|uniref:Uncharacterized protein n=1 Tax=Cytospora mali TaxID=578113 RepID=A0A194V0U0_CYTMA|nr:hypothetical protein VP1G_04854 [Valsa mali var. pyri (nom. inval.)]
MAGTKSASPASTGDLHPETTTPERALIRDVFATEFGGAYTQAVDIKTPQLFQALTTKRLDDPDDKDSPSCPSSSSSSSSSSSFPSSPLHTEVLKNTIDLLQRFHLCAPVFPSPDPAAPDNMKRNVEAMFWRATFCRYFCDDIAGMDEGKVWSDVRRLMAAAMYEPRPARQRGRIASLLWELMGLAAAGLKEEGRLRDMETWAVEVTARVGLWKKLFDEDKGSILRFPVNEDTQACPKDVLPEYNDGESFDSMLNLLSPGRKLTKVLDAMKLFQEQVKALPVREERVHEQNVPKEHAAPQKVVSQDDIPQAAKPKEESLSGDALRMDGVVEHQPSHEEEVAIYEEPGWSTRPPYAHDASRKEPVNRFLSVVGRILDANKVPFNWAKL